MFDIKTMQEVLYRTREIYRAIENGREAISAEDQARVLDEFANISYQAEMIEEAYGVAQKEDFAEIDKLLKEVR